MDATSSSDSSEEDSQGRDSVVQVGGLMDESAESLDSEKLVEIGRADARNRVSTASSASEPEAQPRKVEGTRDARSNPEQRTSGTYISFTKEAVGDYPPEMPSSPTEKERLVQQPRWVPPGGKQTPIAHLAQIKKENPPIAPKPIAYGRDREFTPNGDTRDSGHELSSSLSSGPSPGTSPNVKSVTPKAQNNISPVGDHHSLSSNGERSLPRFTPSVGGLTKQGSQPVPTVTSTHLTAPVQPSSTESPSAASTTPLTTSTARSSPPKANPRSSSRSNSGAGSARNGSRTSSVKDNESIGNSLQRTDKTPDHVATYNMRSQAIQEKQESGIVPNGRDSAAEGQRTNRGIGDGDIKYYQSIENKDRIPMLPRNKDDSECSPLYENQHEAKKQAYDKLRHSSRISLWRTLSLLYGLLVIAIGIVLPLAEIMTNKIDIYYYEGFYVYLYGLSILFLLYVYIYLVRHNNTEQYRRTAIPCRSEIFEVTPQGVKKVDTNDDSMHTGSFYLRVGAVVFGIGSMIFSGLRFGQFFEISQEEHCYNLMRGITPIAHMVFIFFQLYFIFLNAKMAVHQYKGAARFGLIHMASTNLCVWFATIIRETVHAVNFERANQGKASVNSSSSEMKSISAGEQAPWGMHDECVMHPIMGTIIEDTAPYLYPLFIEHCLIVAAILFTMWKTTDNVVSLDRATDEEADYKDTDSVSKDEYRTDCHSTNKGLFCGIFVVVLAIISLILFFVLVDGDYSTYGIVVSHSFEILLYFLTTIFVFSAFLRMQGLKFDVHFSTELDHVLLYVSVIGVYIYGLFGFVASHHIIFSADMIEDFFSEMKKLGTLQSLLILVSSVLVIIQSTLQTVFIVDASRRYSYKADHETRKPGRELVTLLLMCNVSMWAINTFEPKRSVENPVQLNFFGSIAWMIVNNLVVPLTIFFRFHSTVCLVEIWRRAYKVKLL